MHEVLVNRLGGLSLPRKSVVRLTDRPDMTLDVYRGHKNNNTTNQIIFTILQGTIVVTLTSTSASVSHLKVLRQRCFYVMGKALSYAILYGDSSCLKFERVDHTKAIVKVIKVPKL